MNATQLLNPTFQSINASINSMNGVVQPFQALLPRSLTGIVRALNESVQNMTSMLKSLSNLHLQLVNVHPFNESTQSVTNTTVHYLNKTCSEFLRPVSRSLGQTLKFMMETADVNLNEMGKLLDSERSSLSIPAKK